MDFMHILGQKEATWNTIFSIFERRLGILDIFLSFHPILSMFL